MKMKQADIDDFYYSSLSNKLVSLVNKCDNKIFDLFFHTNLDRVRIAGADNTKWFSTWMDLGLVAQEVLNEI